MYTVDPRIGQVAQSRGSDGLVDNTRLRIRPSEVVY